MLSFREIKELIALVSEKGLAGLEIERAGFRLRIEGSRHDGAAAGAVLYPSIATGGRPAVAAPPPAIARVAEVAPEAERADEEAAGIHYITSPIVGTFYRAPSPDTAPFASPGDRIERGKVLCIIEAMKLMNEIESDVAGEVVEILPQNGQPVEYGERLVAIRTA